MVSRIRVIAVAVLAIALCACTLDVPPFSAASLSIHSTGESGASSDLTSKQSQKLHEWLNVHRSGWSQTPASYVPRVVVAVKHNDGKVSSLDVLPSLLVANGPFGQYSRPLADDEERELLAILGVRAQAR